MHPGLISLLIVSVAWLTFKLIRIGRRDKTLPPGPPTLPILGNIHLLPFQFTFIKFSEWATVYGGIMSLKVANGTIIVVSDMAIAKELLDDRASETASRPYLYAVDVVTGNNYFSLAKDGKYILGFNAGSLETELRKDSLLWRMGRKAIQPLLTPQAVQAHLPVAEAETTQLLYDILRDPEEIYFHASRTTLSFITSVVFGKPTPRYDSPDATLFRDYMRHFSSMMSPAAAPVDLVPFLKYVPERWAPWKQLWRETRRLQRALYFSLLEYAENKDDSGSGSKTFIQQILDRQTDLKLSREMIGYTGGILLDAGADTISSFIQSLVLCLIKNPAIMRKAQAEIDSVIGDSRLPVYSDIQDLPYIQAMINETHRMRPVVPLGAPHAAINDCNYRGYTIPKGAPILLNIWGIFHNPNLFERPDEFWPERYLLTPDGTIPGLDKGYTIRPTLQFGSGNRICPGIHLANTNLSLTVMRLLWAFDFAPLDVSKLSISQPIAWSMDEEYVDGIIFSPKPFKCKVTPRGKNKTDIIEEYYKINADSGYSQ